MQFIVYSYKGKTWYIPGTLSGNWGHDDAQKMTTDAQDATMVSFTTAELAANQELQFKFTCGDWGQCEHGYSDIVVAEGSLAVTDNGGNLAFTPANEGTYTVTFDIISKQVTIAAAK